MVPLHPLLHSVPVPHPVIGPEAWLKVDRNAPVTALVTFWVQISPSALREYSMRTSSVPFTTPATPSSCPKLPNNEARTHHSPFTAPHHELSGQDSNVVWIKSPVPLDMPGQRKSIPFCGLGAVPGTSVVTAWTMLDFVGPRERAPPQVSRWRRRPAETWVARRTARSGKSISGI